ncbi:MAG: phosphoribosylamine--glycine ligase [Chloroflexi bacterium]|nr:phosphoribosylamine--glycine ligase [Chloroflexota bacterium]
MKLLLIGSGAREHAIAWKLGQSPGTEALFIAPGNGGTRLESINLPLGVTDVLALASFAKKEVVGLTFVGPEAALAAGIVDTFQAKGLPIFGPTAAAARLETSKAFAKEFMARHGIPTAQGMAFDSHQEAQRFVERREGPIVVKADGLAGGKGVTVARSRAEALAALDRSMNLRTFGDAGDRVVIEEFMEGREVSVFAFTDGQRLSPLVAACDYKRAYDDDQGPNTGGMGSYSPPEFWTTMLAQEADERIFRPAILGMEAEGCLYRGVLYGGLMLTKEGLKVVEFNARLGDPETQVVLPRLASDLVEIASAIAEGDMSKADVAWGPLACVGVVMASTGYPDAYTTGHPIHGLEEATKEALVFHAGTISTPGGVATSGGRVLTVVGCGASLAEAREQAYASVRRIRFRNAFYRADIAAKALAPAGK